MNINILVAKIKKKGYTQSMAESFAIQLVAIAKNYKVSVEDLFTSMSDAEFTDLGAFVMNNTRRQGYVTGKTRNIQPNPLVNREILD